MAFSSNHLSLFFLLTTLLSSSLPHTHARHAQFFNKVSATTTTTNNNNLVPDGKDPSNNQENEPNFHPDNENGYGLYSHQPSQLPPSTAADAATKSQLPPHKYLPKNYNPVAYVTQPEDMPSDSTSTFPEPETFNNNNYYNNDAQNYYNNNNQQDMDHSSEYRSTYNYNNVGGSSSSSSHQQGLTDNNIDGFRPQGMSDTRFVDNGRYFYDVNSNRYSINHPYENLRAARNDEYSNRNNYYGDTANSYDGFRRQNSMGGYQSQDEQNYNMP